MDDKKMREDAVATMSRYVQFDTTNPPGNEMPAAIWLSDQLTNRGITKDIKIYEPLSGRGLVVARISGSENLKPLMINHHIDVVAADPEKWSHPPFSGDCADGFIWGARHTGYQRIGCHVSTGAGGTDQGRNQIPPPDSIHRRTR